MIINDSNTDQFDVEYLCDCKKEKIMAFLQGAIYCWCKNRKEEYFSVPELLGGENYDWNSTPLIALYEHYIGEKESHDEAVYHAGLDVGTLLKQVVRKDDRRFSSLKEGTRARKYLWIPSETSSNQ